MNLGGLHIGDFVILKGQEIQGQGVFSGLLTPM